MVLGGVRRSLEELPGWWLAALLVIAPWAYGTTFPETKDWLGIALCGLSLPFTVSLICQRRWPRISWISVLLALVILTQGWLMTWNAKLVYDSRLSYFHVIPQPAPWLPGTVDHAISWHQMLLITGLFFAFWTASDLVAQERWRQRLWLVMSLTGVSLMLLGLAQRLTGAPGIFWRSDLDCGPTFFATYRYHANAGAFINIIFPLILAQSVSAFRKDSSHLAKAFWLVAALCVFASAFVNVSRAATVITLGVFVVFFARQLSEILRTRRHLSKILLGIVAVIAIIGVGALVWAIGFGDTYHRWTDPRYNIATDARFLAYDAIEHRVLPRAGWWGFGPATFRLVFPFFTNGLGPRIWGYWEYAHEDYLQTLVEWGFCGAAAWFLFFGHSIARGCWALWRRQRTWDGRTRVFAVASLLALGSVVVHAMVDFPMQIASLQLYTAAVLGVLASLPYLNAQRARRKATRVAQTLEQKPYERHRVRSSERKV
jgi:hypothetical protein